MLDNEFIVLKCVTGPFFYVFGSNTLAEWFTIMNID